MKMDIQSTFESLIDHPDETLFGELIINLTTRFQVFFLRNGANHSDSEDLCQIFFIQIWKSRHTFKKGNPVFPWFYTIARNILNKHYQNKSKFKVINLTDNIPIENNSDNHIQILDIYSVLNDFSEEKKIVFQLKFEQGYSLKQIAQHLQIPEGTAKSRMFSILEHIRNKLIRR